jgi:hypothetical protein
MWTCPKCGRIFEKEKQVHSCKKVPLDQHFKNKDYANELFDCLVDLTNTKVGKCRIISLPCCIHLFGKYDFLAALPKRKGIEIRFALDRIIESPRLKQSVPLSNRSYKNCFDIQSIKDFDSEFIGWLKESYNLRGS